MDFLFSSVQLHYAINLLEQIQFHNDSKLTNFLHMTGRATQHEGTGARQAKIVDLC